MNYEGWLIAVFVCVACTFIAIHFDSKKKN